MLDAGPPEQTGPEPAADDDTVADARPACVALVPMVTAAQWSQIPNLHLSRTDSTFVTHLIATAEHDPQTRSLRRATAADAQTAYQSVIHHNQDKAAGVQMRQIV